MGLITNFDQYIDPYPANIFVLKMLSAFMSAAYIKML